MKIKKTKRLLSVLLTAAVATSIITTAPINSSAVDTEKQNVMNKTYQAGGFTSDDTRKVDSDYKYYFEVDSVKEAKNVAAQFGLDKDEYELSDKLNGKVIVQADVTKSEAQQIENSPLVESVEKNYNVNGCAETEQGSALTQWYLDAMNVGEPSQTPENTVKVELLDSGVSYVSALENVRHVSLIDDEGGSPLFTDYNGHGTALAGLIAGNSEDFKGVNPNAELYDVQVLDNNLQAPISKIVEGIYWGIENDVDIINMSFGTAYNSEALRNAITAASNAGIMLIAAAGNDSEAGTMYPAAYPEVIAVGSTDSNGDYVGEYAGQNSSELAAPGTQIVSTGILDGYSAGCGTSLSTAEVTGIASRLLEKDGATADFVRYLMKSTGRTVADSSARLVDLGSALENYDSALVAYTENPAAPVEYVNNSEPESYDVGGIVTGLWYPDNHALLADDAANQSDDLILNNTDFHFIRLGARAADYEFRNVNTFSGTGNYVANLEMAYVFINNLRASGTVRDAINATKSEAKKHRSVYVLNDDGTFDTEATNSKLLVQMLHSFDLIYNNSIKYGTDAYSEIISTIHNLKYVAIGLSFHMIGDIYAHRSMIPSTLSITNQVFNGNHYVFSDNSGDAALTFTQTNLNNLMNGETSGLRSYMCYRALLKARDYGILESRKIKLFSRYYQDEDEQYKGKAAYYYEDNPSFYNKRYTNAADAMNLIAANTVDRKFYFNYQDLVPNWNGLKLNKLKTCVTKFSKLYDEDGNMIGTDDYFDPSMFTNSEWSSCSYD